MVRLAAMTGGVLLGVVFWGAGCDGGGGGSDGGDGGGGACPALGESAHTLGGESCTVAAADCAHPVTCGGGTPTEERCDCVDGRWRCGIVDCPVPEVGLPEGILQGTADGRVRAFRGIPYAQPPVGDLRWRAPRPLPEGRALVDAGDFGAGCMQILSPVSETTFIDEDCLTLNVWAPAGPGPHPVMVFIHGGGFTTGATAYSVYDGTAAARQGVVLVTMNYRLGPFGFLAHPALTGEDPEHPTSGAWGLEDQRAALAWVRDRIAAFGGDPANVTLFGQSAGGMAVCIHSVSPRSAGLFRRVALQSGPCVEGLLDLAEAETQGEELAAALRCDDAPDPLACLRDAPAEEVLAALPTRPAMLFGEGALWAPPVDDWNLPDQPADRVRDGGPAEDLEVLLGTNGDEGSIIRIMLSTAAITAADYEGYIDMVFGDLGPQVLERYPISRYGTAENAMDEMAGHFGFICPARRMARWWTARGARVWLYRFLHAPGYLPLPGMDSYHTAELPFVFDSPPSGSSFSREEAALADAMSGYWTRFAEAGDPRAPAATDWPLHEPTLDPHLVLDLTIDTAEGYDPDDCDFWDDFPLKP